MIFITEESGGGLLLMPTPNSKLLFMSVFLVMVIIRSVSHEFIFQFLKRVAFPPIAFFFFSQLNQRKLK